MKYQSTIPGYAARAHGETRDGQPDILPDLRFIAYLRDGDPEPGTDIVALSIDPQQETPVGDWTVGSTLVGWLPSDRPFVFHNIQSRAGTVWRVSMTGGRPTGRAAVVRELVPVTYPIGNGAAAKDK